MRIPKSPILRLHRGYLAGEFQVRDIAQRVINRYQSNHSLGSHLHFSPEEILAEAEKLDSLLPTLRKRGHLPPLFGIPIAIKDNIHVQGQPTTCASRILKPFIAPFDAAATGHLRDSGALPAGKTNMDEFAMGGSCENGAFGASLNPHDTTRVAGGSSGGSAVAVVAGITPLALGSDTGGSIRQPASYTGCIGYKPSYGMVSRFGLVAYASSFDQIGPFATTVGDAARLLAVISRPSDPVRDMTHHPVPFSWSVEPPATPPPGITLAVPRIFLSDSIAGEVLSPFREAIRFLQKQGVPVHEVDIPILDEALPVYYILATAEASSNLARYDGIRYGFHKNGDTLFSHYAESRSAGFGAEVTRRILLGTYVLSSGYYDAYYNRALKLREAMAREFDRLFSDYSFLITPTTPTTAFKLGECLADPLTMYYNDICTIIANLIAGCAINVPIGLGAMSHLPVGLQFIGKRFDDGSLLRWAATFEALYPSAGTLHPKGVTSWE